MLVVAEQLFANVRSAEARTAGGEKIHGRKLTGSGTSVERAGIFCGL